MYKCSKCDYKLEDRFIEFAPPTITRDKVCPLCGEKLVFTNELLAKFNNYKKTVVDYSHK